MKRFLVLSTFCLLAFQTLAQDATAPSPAEQEEKIKRLSSDIETLLAANADLQKKISELRDEVARLYEGQAKAAANDSTLEPLRDDLRKLADKIQEVDKKRIADKEIVVEKLEDIERIIKRGMSSAPSKPTSKKTTDNGSTTSPRPENTAEYEIREGDVLSKILSQVNAQFKSEGKKTITQKQLLDANPGLNPDRLRVGQTIYIPLPEK